MVEKLRQSVVMKRLQADTPDFWKSVRRWAIIVGAISGGAAASIATAGIAAPAWVTFILLTIATSSATLVGSSSLTTK